MASEVELDGSARRGQFMVFVGDDKVIERKGGLIAKLTGRPWPSAEDVTSAVKRGLAR